ncbi:murein biosynthesis integral membrane protein MurJ [Thermoanaerobacter sp. CM-CNRG TB177]|uniref:murein biosynthesis integral membrane protein MurJ n=1 Tax=Thermoanaerobacter sp. CM-CNRG TB177 TaxID=2800659 RepID=UPI001BDF180F|nr:murein biosynthesis integral membrane protein MurJ [Thermoanaerobacter sp. CM-CNRG TB177]MBT1279125.1 murein biosynthesis integral membrane protein MurJ [Thermoanaerobacter sp. CM-CNRG TB177]
MSTAKKTVKAAGIIMIITLLSKVFGFLRDMTLAFQFGTSVSMDVYNMATVIPMILFAAVTAAIATTVVPIFTEYFQKDGKRKAFDFINNLLGIVLLATIILTILGFLFAPYLVKFVAPAFTGEKFELTVKLTTILLPTMVFIAASNIFTGALQSMEHFTIPAMIGIPYNIIVITVAILYGDKFGITAVAYSIIIATFLQALMQLPVLYKLGYRFRVKVDFKDEGVKRVVLLAMPVLMGTGIQTINVYVDRVIASFLPDGSIAALNYANRLNMFALGIFSTAIATVIYPVLSKHSVADDTEGFLKSLNFAVSGILYILIPVSVGAMVLRMPIIKVLFERGAFDENSTYLTSIALFYYAIGMTAYGLRDVLSRSFYSMKDTKTPMINGAMAVLLNIALNLILVRYLKLGGLALSTSIAAIFAIFLLFTSLKRKVGKIDGKYMFMSFIRAMLASIVMGVLVHFMYNNFIVKMPSDKRIYEAIALFISILAGAIIYSVIVLVIDRSAFSYFKKGIKFVNSKLVRN